MASTYIYRDLGTPTNAYKGTVSHWVKRSGVGASTEFGSFSAWANGVNSTRSHCNWYDDTIYFYSQQHSMVLQTNRKFRDTNAWYHVVIAWDTTQSTASDRVKIYVNGVQETSFSTANYPAQNSVLEFNVSGRRFGVGCLAQSNGSAASTWNGSISHFHFVDGSQLAPTVFGSTDSTTGEWKINTSPSYTVGNNGFFWLKDSIATTDHSSNSNTFTVGAGTLTKTEDCPSNVFATFNPLSYRNNDSQRYVSFSEGNNTAVGNSSTNNGNAYSSLGASSGKFYCEIKATDVRGTGYPNIGFMNEAGANRTNGSSGQISTQGGTAYVPNGRLFVDSTETASWGASFTDNDIIQLAMDLDNGALYFGKNGTWQNSGNPASGASKTGAARSFTPDGTFYFFGTAVYESSCEVKANFGNGYFGTTAVSSAGTNASNLGIFEYDVPAGYTALCTKGLNE